MIATTQCTPSPLPTAVSWHRVVFVYFGRREASILSRHTTSSLPATCLYKHRGLIPAGFVPLQCTRLLCLLTLCACIHRAAVADRACVYHVANHVSPLMYIIVCLYLVAYLLSPCIVARVGPFQAPYRYIHIIVGSPRGRSLTQVASARPYCKRHFCQVMTTLWRAHPLS